MAIQTLTRLKDLTFSKLAIPKIPFVITQNLVRVSIWGTLSSGATALISTIFNKSLEGSLKEFAPYVFKTSLTSCITFALVVAYCSRGIMKNRPHEVDFDKTLHNRVSLFAISAPCGLVAAAATWVFKSEPQLSSLTKRVLCPYLGLSIVGLTLWLFLNSQQKQIDAFKTEAKKEKKD